MVRDGTAGPVPDGAATNEGTLEQDAAVAVPFNGGTTSGLTALDRAHRGETGAVRVLIVGGAIETGGFASGSGSDVDTGLRNRLAIAARAEGFAPTSTDAARAETALGEGNPHAIIVDASAIGGGAEALVSRLAAAAPQLPIVVVGPDEERASTWIDAGADDHLDHATVTPEVLGRAVESAIARCRARDLRRRLEHADRLTTIGQIAAGVAHEVNNPAAFLLMNLRTCREYVGELRAITPDAAAGDGTPIAASALLDEMAEMLEDNVRGVERIVAIVEALRSYVRMDGDQPQSIDVADVCRDSAALVASRLRQHARFELAVEESAMVRADPRRLSQVLVNLLINACDACELAERAPAGGHRIAIAVARRTDHVVIRVTDTGIGMPPVVRARVFEPFFTTKPRGRGTGLGLSIARDIVERSGGRIDVDSELGGGSRFDVVLPIDLGAAAGVGTGTVAAVDEHVAPRERARVLIIDDELALTTALRRQLKHHHDVAVVNDGRAALALVEREPFDVVLCDVMMPDMDGIAVHAALARRHPRLASRLIFMSGGLFGDANRDALTSIGAPVLGKPVPIGTLLDAIDATRQR